MASVSKRKVGDKWYIRFQEEGKKEVTKRFPGTFNKSRIQRKVEWYREEIALDRFDPWGQEDETLGLTLSEAIKKYIKWGLDGRWKIQNGKSHTANTTENRLTYMMDALGDIPVERLDPDEIQYWLTRKQKLKRQGDKWVPTGEIVSPVTMKTWKITINSFLRWLYDNGHVGSLQQVTLPKQVKDKAKDIINQPSGISLSDMNRFCEGSHLDWVVPCAQLLFWTMMRHDEILNLRPDDFSDNLQYITYGNEYYTPKSGKVTLPLLSPARRVVEEYQLHKKDAAKPIFKASYDYLNVAFRRVSRKVFENQLFPPHSFRHGGIIYLRSVLSEPGLVTELARHASQETTDRIYGGVDPVYLKRAVDREELDVEII